MKVVSLCAQKGGVGKTTLALHLAVCARQNGKNAKIIDLNRVQFGSDSCFRLGRAARVPM